MAWLFVLSVLFVLTVETDGGSRESEGGRCSTERKAGESRDGCFRRKKDGMRREGEEEEKKGDNEVKRRKEEEEMKR
jgi:hypothetical protein